MLPLLDALDEDEEAFKSELFLLREGLLEEINVIKEFGQETFAFHRCLDKRPPQGSWYS